MADQDSTAVAQKEQARVLITRTFVGLCHMQVCAVKDATDEEILSRCNSDNPSGTQAGWSTVYRMDDEFYGRTAPVRCEHNLERLHFMVGC